MALVVKDLVKEEKKISDREFYLLKALLNLLLYTGLAKSEDKGLFFVSPFTKPTDLGAPKTPTN
jgi:hypothetical protein